MSRRVFSRGLGQTPQIVSAVGPTAFKLLISSVLAGAGAAVVGSMLGGPDSRDSWMDRSVFNSRMLATYTGFLMTQCEVGGAQVNQPYGCDDDGHNCLCAGGTPAKCSLPPSKLTEWRALIRGFSAFYEEVGGSAYFEGDDWMVSNPTLAQVDEARGYARALVKFFIELPSVCPGYTLPFDMASIVLADEGTSAQQVAEEAALTLATPDPAWVKGLKYAAWGLGAVAVLWVGSTLYTVFGKRKG